MICTPNMVLKCESKNILQIIKKIWFNELLFLYLHIVNKKTQ
jgi:hypothetical protein